MPPSIISAEKMKACKFFDIYVYSQIRILTLKQVTSVLDDVLEPFKDTEIKVFVLILLSMFACALICRMFDRFLEFNEKPLLGSYVQLFLAFFLYQGAPCGTSCISNKILIILFSFAGMILVCFFYADFKTSLIVEDDPNSINTLEDLRNARPPKIIYTSNLCGLRDLIEKEMTEEQKVLNKLLKYDERFKSLDFKKVRSNYYHLKSLAMTGVFAGVDGEQVLLYIARTLCTEFVNVKLHLSEPVMEVLLGVPYSKSLPFHVEQHMKKRIKAAVEAGIISHVQRRIFDDIPECMRRKSDDQNRSLSIEALKLIYKFWGLGLSISVLAFFCEYAHYYLNIGLYKANDRKN